MPKIYDKERGATYRVDERLWFKLQQPLLLWMANHPEGRKLLALDSCDLPRIDEIHKNRVSMHRYERVGKNAVIRHTTTDFRVGAKWANVIRYRWDAFLELSKEYAYYMERGRVPFNELALVQVEPATTLTAFPDPNPETTTVDGYAYQFQNNVSWTTLVNAAGNNVDDPGSGNQLALTQYRSETAADEWDSLVRSFALFDTSSIGLDDIDDATLSVFGDGKSDGTSTTPDVNVYSAALASPTVMQAGDYDSIGGTAFSTAVTYAGFSTVAYNDFAFNASGIAGINKTGVSHFGLRNANYDAADNAPTHPGSILVSSLQADSADVTGTSNDPKLVVNHTEAAATFIPRVMFM